MPTFSYLLMEAAGSGEMISEKLSFRKIYYIIGEGLLDQSL